LTVSKGLIQEYEREFGVRPILFRSVPKYKDIKPRATDSRRIRLVYHGAANKNRKLENLVELATLLDDRFSLDLILVGDHKNINHLTTLTSKIKNVSIKEPVEYQDIIENISQYDIGLAFFEPTTFNLLHALPNKFFEFIQARLMLAVGPSPDMAELVYKYELGIVSDDFTIKSLKNKLNSLTYKDIDKFKSASHRASVELNFENEKDVFLTLLSSFNILFDDKP
jgi:hypothetical protein